MISFRTQKVPHSSFTCLFPFAASPLFKKRQKGDWKVKVGRREQSQIVSPEAYRPPVIQTCLSCPKPWWTAAGCFVSCMLQHCQKGIKTSRISHNLDKAASSSNSSACEPPSPLAEKHCTPSQGYSGRKCKIAAYTKYSIILKKEILQYPALEVTSVIS